ncbi:hypothetical protein RHAB15C_0000980 [Candidatus Rhabdochlamydia porcellionis]|uniref:Uncharacterized protein n=1 Tax=Candidatus Rhabdochlamydia porcellionis TaxID=225148 RepID=A0ABX8Z4R8_9BACT|nr:hypothetical protein RHAB15C_0000980 [Candidatus Rhabdochlamydia porcellionis]
MFLLSNYVNLNYDLLIVKRFKNKYFHTMYLLIIDLNKQYIILKYLLNYVKVEL